MQAFPSAIYVPTYCMYFYIQNIQAKCARMARRFPFFFRCCCCCCSWFFFFCMMAMNHPTHNPCFVYFNATFSAPYSILQYGIISDAKVHLNIVDIWWPTQILVYIYSYSYSVCNILVDDMYYAYDMIESQVCSVFCGRCGVLYEYKNL